MVVLLAVFGVVSIIFGILHSPKSHEESDPIGYDAADISIFGIIFSFLLKFLNKYLARHSYWLTKIFYFVIGLFLLWGAYHEYTRPSG
jgi:preprotein translocase subunit SecG